MAVETWLLDIGNTSLKLFRLEADTQCLLRALDPVRRFANKDDFAAFVSDTFTRINPQSFDVRVYVASVRSDDETQELLRCLQIKNVTLHQVSTSADSFGLKNSYAKPEKMGVDRWLAMLGGQLLSRRPFIVIDAGTAITVDAVANNVHIGGWIAPGYQLALNAVTGNTRRVFQAQFESAEVAFGNDTEACLHLGCVAQLNGLVLVAQQLMSTQHPEFTVILAGGDRDRLLSVKEMLATKHIVNVNNIVFYGLLRFALAEMPLQMQRKCAESLDI
ncbi:type III pantothenate kinase [Alteromonas flava]|uniref:type III pantothenate kinase n=1 Tax=Alteromonas flava TaxID=2048003 RepID=UPI0013DB2979|nr:type III pantothenate kinase [Alteromonas flava]